MIHLLVTQIRWDTTLPLTILDITPIDSCGAPEKAGLIMRPTCLTPQVLQHHFKPLEHSTVRSVLSFTEILVADRMDLSPVCLTYLAKAETTEVSWSVEASDFNMGWVREPLVSFTAMPVIREGDCEADTTFFERAIFIYASTLRLVDSSR